MVYFLREWETIFHASFRKENQTSCTMNVMCISADLIKNSRGFI